MPWWVEIQKIPFQMCVFSKFLPCSHSISCCGLKNISAKATPIVLSFAIFWLTFNQMSTILLGYVLESFFAQFSVFLFWCRLKNFSTNYCQYFDFISFIVSIPDTIANRTRLQIISKSKAHSNRRRRFECPTKYWDHKKPPGMEVCGANFATKDCTSASLKRWISIGMDTTKCRRIQTSILRHTDP